MRCFHAASARLAQSAARCLSDALGASTGGRSEPSFSAAAKPSAASASFQPAAVSGAVLAQRRLHHVVLRLLEQRGDLLQHRALELRVAHLARLVEQQRRLVLERVGLRVDVRLERELRLERPDEAVERPQPVVRLGERGGVLGFLVAVVVDALLVRGPRGLGLVDDAAVRAVRLGDLHVRLGEEVGAHLDLRDLEV